jgi:hypothetical protein
MEKLNGIIIRKSLTQQVELMKEREKKEKRNFSRGEKEENFKHERRDLFCFKNAATGSVSA